MYNIIYIFIDLFYLLIISLIISLIITVGWYIIWNTILYEIAIIREVLGFDEPKNKYNKEFTLKYKH